jgi:hypothetical protein
MRYLILKAVAALLCSTLVQATPPFRKDTVLVEKSSGLLGRTIETQMYAPATDGEFPMVVLNH